MAAPKTYWLALTALSTVALLLTLLRDCCKGHSPSATALAHDDNWKRANIGLPQTRVERPRKVRERTRPPETLGALYFAYNQDPDRAAGYVAAVAKSAASLKRHDQSIPVAVLTNAKDLAGLHEQHYSVIDYFLPIQDKDIVQGRAAKQGRQWWTRTLYLNHTPFDVTLQLDSDRSVCSSVKHLRTLIRGYDMLHVSVGVLPIFDNGVMVYRNNAKFQAMHRRWLEGMERDAKVGDDQPALIRALDDVSDEIGFKSGVLPPIFQVKLAPAVGEQWGSSSASHSLVLNGDVKIVAGTETQCDLPARNASRPRVVVTNINQSSLVFSQNECNDFMGGRCRTKEMDWEGTFDVMSRAEYVSKVKTS
jgi:hypothetical protein